MSDAVLDYKFVVSPIITDRGGEQYVGYMRLDAERRMAAKLFEHLNEGEYSTVRYQWDTFPGCLMGEEVHQLRLDVVPVRQRHVEYMPYRPALAYLPPPAQKPGLLSRLGSYFTEVWDETAKDKR